MKKIKLGVLKMWSAQCKILNLKNNKCACLCQMLLLLLFKTETVCVVFYNLSVVINFNVMFCIKNQNTMNKTDSLKIILP